MMWGYNMGWGMWLGMGISTLLLLILIGLLGWAVVQVGRLETPRLPQQPDRPSALQLLDERFARGDIEPDDYNQRRRLLSDQR